MGKEARKQISSACCVGHEGQFLGVQFKTFVWQKKRRFSVKKTEVEACRVTQIYIRLWQVKVFACEILKLCLLREKLHATRILKVELRVPVQCTFKFKLLKEPEKKKEIF